MSVVRKLAESDKTAIRAFHVNVPEAALADLRRRLAETRLPNRRPSRLLSGRTAQGPQQVLRYWQTDYDWRKVEHGSTPCRTSSLNRRAGHPLHTRPFQARERAASDRNARLARLGGRAIEDRRAAHQSHGARRKRVGRLPSGDPVDARLRVLRQADGHRLGARAHRTCLDHADAAARLRAFRRAGWRLGCCRHRYDRRAGAA